MSDNASPSLPSFAQTASLRAPVKRRRVFYIPGYDPFPPRRYRELYRKEAAEQAKISGYDIALKARTETTPQFGWSVAATIDGQEVTTEVSVLLWSDVVRGSMGHSILSTYGQLLKTAWIYVSSGALRRLMWLRKGPIIAALYPIVMLLFQLSLALAAASVVGGMLSSWIYPRAGWVAFFPIMIVILRWFKSMDSKFYAYYLMHDYAHSAKEWGAYPDEIEQNIADFKAQIAQALKEDHDEVLVVGHSSGAHLGVSILADLLRAQQGKRFGPALSFLSLGHVVPMVSFLPKATRLRRDLAELSKRAEITWVDVSAPGDGCSFALCDPVAVTGVAPEGKRWPLVFSAAFTQSLSAERWEELKRRYFRLHFQYLCAFDRPKDYDYFQITAGPMTLGARFKDRPASRSRIDIAASPYTDT